MRRAARQDSNAKLIVGTLRAIGWYWIDTSRMGDGFPDGIAIKGQKVRFIEIKAPRGKQRAAQAKFEAEIPAGWYVMLRTVDEALALR